MPQRLPRPLPAQQDQILQRELLCRNDVAANALLVIRHTGMRIGECADLACDCLRSTGPQQWAIHVPLGKLKTERMVPVDSFVCELVQRLRFFRSLDSEPADASCYRALAARKHSSGSCANISTKCASPSTCPSASFHTNYVTLTQQRCFGPV